MIKVEKVNNQTLLNQVFEIRKIVFVLEQKCPPELEWENEEESTHFLATNENHKPCGAARWRKTNNGYKLERFAVLKNYRGRGVGQQLLRTVLQDLPPLKDNEMIYVHAQVQAMGLYEKFGFQKIGHLFEEAGIQHYKMIKT